MAGLAALCWVRRRCCSCCWRWLCIISGMVRVGLGSLCWPPREEDGGECSVLEDVVDFSGDEGGCDVFSEGGDDARHFLWEGNEGGSASNAMLLRVLLREF